MVNQVTKLLLNIENSFETILLKLTKKIDFLIIIKIRHFNSYNRLQLVMNHNQFLFHLLHLIK